ncbi:MAG: hypothetical protein HRT90_03620 [Candidatus Margulisbacteria bacterium]|nr:hypothetical protein [Candidatus Margulisiibacteriota bacterium]
MNDGLEKFDFKLELWSLMEGYLVDQRKSFIENCILSVTLPDFNSLSIKAVKDQLSSIHFWENIVYKNDATFFPYANFSNQRSEIEHPVSFPYRNEQIKVSSYPISFQLMNNGSFNRFMAFMTQQVYPRISYKNIHPRMLTLQPFDCLGSVGGPSLCNIQQVNCRVISHLDPRVESNLTRPHNIHSTSTFTAFHDKFHLGSAALISNFPLLKQSYALIRILSFFKDELIAFQEISQCMNPEKSKFLSELKKCVCLFQRISESQNLENKDIDNAISQLIDLNDTSIIDFIKNLSDFLEKGKYSYTIFGLSLKQLVQVSHKHKTKNPQTTIIFDNCGHLTLKLYQTED